MIGIRKECEITRGKHVRISPPVKKQGTNRRKRASREQEKKRGRNSTHQALIRTSPIKLYVVPRICLSNVWGKLRAKAAIQVGVRRALDGADGVHVADDTWLDIGVGHVAGVLFAGDPHLVNDPVCRDEGCHG
jgi:hypothetical protein